MDAGRVTVPVWVRSADAATVALLVLAAVVAANGVIRLDLDVVRVSLSSWLRPLAAALVVGLLRHLKYSRPSLPERVRTVFAGLRRRPEVAGTLPVAVTSRLAVLLVGFFAVLAIGYAAGAPSWRANDDELLNLPARFDAGWYLGIATEGYEYRPRREDLQQPLVFFPAMPMLMRAVSPFVGRQTLWAGVLVSILAFGWAATYVFRLARQHMDDAQAATAVALLAAYPFALFYSVPYTEALFLLAATGAWYHFSRGDVWPTSAFGLLAGLTRPNGCLLSVPLGLMAIAPVWQGGRLLRPAVGWGPVVQRLLLASTPGLGMLLYSSWVYGFTGDPFTWVRLQGAWGRGSQGLLTFLGKEAATVSAYGLGAYITSNVPNFLNVLAVLLALVSLAGVWRRFGLPAAAMVGLNVTAAVASGGWMSAGRVTSVLFPVFLWLGAAVPPAHRTAWTVGFAVLQAFAAVLFFTWRPMF